MFSFAHECAALQTRLPPSAAFSHLTAARLHRLPLPWTLADVDVFDVTVPRGIRAPRGRRVRGHQRILDSHDVDRRTGTLATTPARTFCDLAALLTLAELVAVGDVILRAAPGRRLPLPQIVAAYPGRRHRRLLHRAVTLLDGRAESPKESELRVCIVEAGFDSPAVNHVVTAGGAFVARVDLAYPQARVAIEYEGDHHRDKHQWRKDIQRRRRLEALGWTYLSVTQADLTDPRPFLADLRVALAAHPAL